MLFVTVVPLLKETIVENSAPNSNECQESGDEEHTSVDSWVEVDEIDDCLEELREFETVFNFTFGSAKR